MHPVRSRLPAAALAAALLTTLAAALPRPAAAQDAVAQFYAGRTLTIVIGSSGGGGFDAYARLLSRHIGRHLPGNPGVIVQNMPGAGSISAAIHMANAAPKDGSQIGMVLAGAVVDALLSDAPRRYDSTRFGFVGNLTTETHACVVRRDAPVRTFADTFTTEIIIGGQGPGSALGVNPVFLRNMFGARLKLVGGYPGAREIVLAIEKGEVHGICGFNWNSAKFLFRDLLNPDGPFRVILHEGIDPHPEFEKLGVPRVTQFAKTDEDRQTLEVFYSTGIINRPVFAPPDIPPERLAALRKAFWATMNDKALLDDAGKVGLDIRPSPGEEVQELVARLYGTRQAVVERIRRILGGG